MALESQMNWPHAKQVLSLCIMSLTSISAFLKATEFVVLNVSAFVN